MKQQVAQMLVEGASSQEISDKLTGRGYSIIIRNAIKKFFYSD